MLSIDGVHIENDLGLHLLADSDETALPRCEKTPYRSPDGTGNIPSMHTLNQDDSLNES